jgi:hypothetical protein
VTPDRDEGRWFAEAVLSLDGLAPGWYEVRVVAARDGAVVARARREIRIVR